MFAVCGGRQLGQPLHQPGHQMIGPPPGFDLGIEDLSQVGVLGLQAGDRDITPVPVGILFRSCCILLRACRCDGRHRWEEDAPGAALFLARERSPVQASADGIGRDAEPRRRLRDRQDRPVASLSIPVGRPVVHGPGIIAHASGPEPKPRAASVRVIHT